jgi:hypothetical protein
MQSGSNSRGCYRPRPPATMATWATAAVLIALVASGRLADAQLPAPTPIQSWPTPTRPVQQPAQINNLNATKPSPSTPAPAAAQTPAPETPKPDWPVNDKPVPAKVTWDSRGLTIEATNSSLDAILKDVATATGAKVDGKVGDERVFGSYGPGSARDVISQLLDGTAYNVLMVGDQGEGTPRQIVLSNRPTGPAPTNNAQNNSDDEAEYEQPQQPGVPIVHNAFPQQGMPPEQNQQQMEERRAEMEQRQEQMRQQQEQQQQQQPQQPQSPQQ